VDEALFEKRDRNFPKRNEMPRHDKIAGDSLFVCMYKDQVGEHRVPVRCGSSVNVLFGLLSLQRFAVGVLLRLG